MVLVYNRNTDIGAIIRGKQRTVIPEILEASHGGKNGSSEYNCTNNMEVVLEKKKLYWCCAFYVLLSFIYECILSYLIIVSKQNKNSEIYTKQNGLGALFRLC